MFYLKMNDGGIESHTPSEEVAVAAFGDYETSATEPVRGYDGKFYLSEEEIPEKPRDIMSEILALESQITPRRLREAALGIAASVDFIAAIETQIAQLRAELAPANGG